MSTAASGDSAYCTSAQFLARVDERTVRQLLSDDGSPAAGSLSSNATLTSILQEASGWVEAAATAGQRYVITSDQNDLSALTGNSAEQLAGIVAHLAVFILWSRRPNMQGGAKPPPMCQMALDFLEALRLGERVFGILENQQAAALDSAVETAAEVAERRGVTYTARRLFGRRNNRLQP